MPSKHHQFQYLFKFLFGICIIFFSIPLLAEIEEKQAIQSPVSQLHETLIKLMQNADSASFQERYALMETVITENFNTPLISKVILSRHWKSLDKKSQNYFIDLFNRLTISTYVNRFDSFSGESFKNLSIVSMKKNRSMVKTELVQPNDDPVFFNYIVQNDNGQWKIISVIANGINDLSLKRAEYSSVIKNSGFDDLVKRLEEKISNLQPKL